MRILVTGSRGQVGTELLRQASDFRIDAVGRHSGELDICDSDAVAKEITSLKPDILVNAAAFTAVDKAEHDENKAYAVNESGAANLARACDAADIPFIHISTDYVFDGSIQEPYREDDLVSPLGVYGKSKQAGEQAAFAACPKSVVLRTAWVFSAHGSNFVKTMLHYGARREELRVVDDQYGNPTAASDIANAIWRIAERLGEVKQPWGVYHYGGTPVTTWRAFAEAIFDEARRQNYKLKVSSVVAIPTEEYPTLTARPENSVLNCEKISTVFDISQPDWRDSLKKVVEELKA